MKIVLFFLAIGLCGLGSAAEVAATKQLKTASFTQNLAISDRMYDYFMAEPGISRTGNAVVPQGMIAFIERRGNWKNFLARMPAKPDFLELRTEMTVVHQPDFSFHPRELDRSIDTAVAAGIDRVQISPVFASALRGFLDKAYGPGKIAEMTDSDGMLLNKAFETTVFYSYNDPDAWKFMERIIRDIVGHYASSPRGKYIVGWNFKYMTNSDWLYPAAKGFYDYSPPARAAYREYLKEKYGDIAALNQKYKTAWPDFDAVEMPRPPFSRIDCSPRWQEFQEFRKIQPPAAVNRIRRIIRELDPARRIISWYTTAIWATSRDTVILDEAVAIAQNNPNQLTSLTCFDYLNPAGEIWGQLALHNKASVDVEPVFNTAQSYLRTFYNCLRFPVAQINWLYVMPRHDPRERPWIVWALNRGALLDEAAQAELVQSPVAAMLSYSDHLLQVGPELRSQLLEPMRQFLHASEAARLQLAWVTDYSDSIDFKRFRAIVIPGATLLRPAAIEKLRSFVSDGGALILAGECVKFDLLDGQETWPLYRALGKTSPPKEREEWSYGKGRVIQLPFPAQDKRIFQELAAVGAAAPVEVTPSGPGAFLKRGKHAWYVGLINTAGRNFTGKVTIPSLPSAIYRAADLMDGTAIAMTGNSFEIKFDFPDEVRFIKIVPAASGLPLPNRKSPQLLNFREIAEYSGSAVVLAGEESGESWIPAGTAAVRPVITAIYPSADPGEERYFRFDFPARSEPGEGAAYIPFPLEHLLKLPKPKLTFRLRSATAGSVDLVLPERSWKATAAARVHVQALPGVWQKFSLDLDRDFGDRTFPWKDLRGELLVYSGRKENSTPPLSFELADVCFQ